MRVADGCSFLFCCRQVVTNCEHWFCDACICEHMLTGAANSNKCPMCRGPIKEADLKRPVAAAAAAGAAAAAAAPAVVFECQTKLHALVRLLREMREKDDTAKALVFSQFSNTLEWLKTKLTEEGFGYQTVSGSMTLKKRAKAIEAFQNAPPTTVFLLSVRSGAVGINLTAASHVFLLEPCLNPALSDQAVGRAWRMGQTRPVQVSPEALLFPSSPPAFVLFSRPAVALRRRLSGWRCPRRPGSSPVRQGHGGGADPGHPEAAAGGKRAVCGRERHGGLQVRGRVRQAQA